LPAVVLVSNPEYADPTYSKFGSSHQLDSHFHCQHKPTGMSRRVAASRHKKSSAFEAKGGKGQPTAKLGPTTRPFPRVQRYVSALAAAAELQSEPGLARSG
jgi:hypothetical protein